MRVVDPGMKEALLEWGERVKELLKEYGDSRAASNVAGAIDQFRGARFSIAVLGKVKRGKSTLINAMLGRRDDLVAPVDRLPASSTVTRFSWSDRETAKVCFHDGRREEISFAQIRDFVTEERNPENSKQVELVEVAAPFAGLDRDVELVDTPGAGSIHEHHDALLHAFLPQADAVIFLTTARMPIDQDELELLRRLKEADIRKIFFAINRVDESSESDIDDAICHNQKALSEAKVNTKHFHRISAKRAFLGQHETGVEGLVSEVAEHLSAHKGQVLRERFRSRVLQAIEPIAQSLQIELEAISQSSEQIAKRLQELEEERDRISGEQARLERKFSAEWKRAVSDFKSDLDQAESRVQSRLNNHLDGTELASVSVAAKALPTWLNETLESELATASSELERALQTATRKLDVEYPRLRVGSKVLSFGKSENERALLTGAAVGAGAATVGGGLVAAGASAAASIAAANTAAAAATTTVAVPSVLSGLLAMIPDVGGFLATFATGTATVSAPAAMTTTPLWVAMSGPVGWTLVGLGVVAVPFAWRLTKIRAKDQLLRVATEQVTDVFGKLRSQRVADLYEVGERILDDFRLRIADQIDELQAALKRAQMSGGEPTKKAQLETLARRFETVLGQVPTIDASAAS